MVDCVFCDIVAKESPASFIYESTDSAGILTLRPMARGHTLVIPRSHAESLAELTSEDGGRLFQGAMRVAKALRRSTVKCDGVNFWLADGAVAGQEVSHVHLHVIPRSEHDSIQLEADRLDPSREEMNATAEEVHSALNSNSN